MSKFLSKDYLQVSPSLETELDSSIPPSTLTKPEVERAFNTTIHTVNIEFNKERPNKQIITDSDKKLANLISENTPLISTTQLKTAINLFANKKCHITLALTKALNDIITDRITEFDLDKLLSQYVSLAISPNEQIYNVWLSNFINKNTSKDIHNAIWLHEKLSIAPSEDFMNQWIIKAAHLINTTPAKEALGSLWALSSLQTINKIPPHINLAPIKTNLTNRIDIPQLLTEKNDVKHKLLTTDYMNNRTILTSEQRNHIIDSQKNIKPTTSESQTKAFKKLFPTAEERTSLIEEAWIEELAVRVDGYIATKNLIIQIDGNNHYSNDFNGDPRLSFQTQVNTELLESLGYKVIRISTYEIGKKGWNTTYKEQINSLPDIITDYVHQDTDHELSDISSYDGNTDNILRILSDEENSDTNLLGATAHPDSLGLTANDIL